MPSQLLAALAALTPQDLLRRRGAVAQLVQDDGIAVGPDGPDGPHPLRLDPLPLVIPAADWALLEAALAQRAELLDLLLADIYGERRLIDGGVLPAEIIIGHPQFVAQADGISTRHRLVLTAADLGRDEAGEWRLLADRTQAPVGAGYAMATRRVTARALAAVHRETDLRRLREFFDAMRIALQETASETSDLAHVAILTDPEGGETGFDEALTATLLGFPIVHAEDLSLDGGRAWLRTTDRPEPIDVIVRRVNGGRADPLDLTGGPGGGVPGLVEATRRGVVTVVNPIGAGVLENPALAAYLPAISRALLDQDPLLPAARTWWCGDAESLRYVGAHLEDLQLAPISPAPDNPRVFVAGLTAAERAELWARVQAQPWAWAASEVLPPWMNDVVTPDGLSPRASVLRTFTVAGSGSPVVLPGGLARLATEAGDRRVPGLRDAIAKDVWVVGEGPGPRASGATPAEPVITGSHGRIASVPLPPRAADDLYWFGRYAERAESTARLIMVADDLVEDHVRRPGTPGYEAMQVLLDAIDGVTVVHRDRPSRRDAAPRQQADRPSAPLAHLHTLTFDGARSGTVRYSARRAARAAGQVRQVLSLDTWIVLSRLERTLTTPIDPSEQLQSVLARTIESFLALSGIAAEGMIRDASWAFFDAGRRVERAQETVRLLRHALGEPHARRVDTLVLDAVLRSRESLISHRRRVAERHPADTRLAIALDLLLTDASNPRALTYQLTQLVADVGTVKTPVREALSAATTVLDGGDIVALARDRDRLTAWLRELESSVRAVSKALDTTTLRHRSPGLAFEEPR